MNDEFPTGLWIPDADIEADEHDRLRSKQVYAVPDADGADR